MYLSDLKEGNTFYLVGYNGWTISSVYKAKVEYYKYIKLGRIIHYLDENGNDCAFTLPGKNYNDTSIITYSHSNFYKTKVFLDKNDVLNELNNFKEEFNNRYNKFLSAIV